MPVGVAARGCRSVTLLGIFNAEFEKVCACLMQPCHALHTGYIGLQLLIVLDILCEHFIISFYQCPLLIHKCRHIIQILLCL